MMPEMAIISSLYAMASRRSARIAREIWCPGLVAAFEALMTCDVARAVEMLYDANRKAGRSKEQRRERAAGKQMKGKLLLKLQQYRLLRKNEIDQDAAKMATTRYANLRAATDVASPWGCLRQSMAVRMTQRDDQAVVPSFLEHRLPYPSNPPHLAAVAFVLRFRARFLRCCVRRRSPFRTRRATVVKRVEGSAQTNLGGALAAGLSEGSPNP